MDDMDYDEDLIGEAPCEFCGDLYPLMLLIEHQTTHLGDIYPEFDDSDLTTNNDFQDVPIAESANINKPQEVKQIEKEITITAPKIEVERTQMSSSYAEPEVIKETFPAKPPETSNRTTETRATKQNEFKKYYARTVEEFTRKRGEKLLVYGPDIDPMEDLESEKQSCKMPNNPLLDDIAKEEDIEDINNLSDDDCDESLEEFWKRARDFLKRNRGKAEC